MCADIDGGVRVYLMTPSEQARFRETGTLRDCSAWKQILAETV